MARSGQQNRPIHRRFRLVCATFACLFLVVCALPRQSAAVLPWQTPGYALRKAAAIKLPAKERECRKRAASGKVATAGGGAADTACLPQETAVVADRGEPAAAARLDDVARRQGFERPGGARAPPAAAA
ncbi:hypothetical protein [Shinella pollutisoli]|uniref:Uncharacterized protein n=1 Tax=Shinella pollutisoli TaxID=2250594 RepID=A0ABV7DMF9_9HYPH|nr:hypothetical protein [Shinella pollutisoli]